jgi:PQQ-dependent dehydrogenase (s-GDH family)
MKYQYQADLQIKNSIIIVAFGLLLLSTGPVMFYSTSTQIESVLAQPEDPFPTPTPAQLAAREQLLKQEGFLVSNLAANFSAPLNILYGPDGALWITERIGMNISRIDPNNGSELSSMPVPGVYQSGGQDGLMGMALDPDFNNTNHIYVAYTYDADPDADVDLSTKLTRFTYDAATNTIDEPLDLISGLSGSTDHNSGRMILGQDGKLYYTIGDQGKNQLAFFCVDNEAQTLPTQEQVAAQNWTAYQGKVLRMNPDGSIPEDNPEINGIKSHIYTYGHRNAQGIAAGPNGDLYVSEHGDNSDDEVNRLQSGGNYGWPYVSGYKDDKAYQYVNWSSAENCEELTFDDVAPPPAGVTVMNESEFDAPNFVQSLHTFYTVENDFNFTNQAITCGEMTSVCYPTVAPSSLRLYTSNAIPGWENTFLMPTLKAGRIFQLALDDNGTALAGDPIELFRSENRYRDVAFSPDGKTIYVITDMDGPVQAMKEGPITPITDLWSPGSLLAFRYVGNASNVQ